MDHKDLMDTRARKAIRVLPVLAETRVQEEDRVHVDHRVFFIHHLAEYRVQLEMLVIEEIKVPARILLFFRVEKVLVETRDRSVQDQRVQEVLRVIQVHWDRRVLEVHKDLEVIRVL